MKSKKWPKSGFFELIYRGIKAGKSTGVIADEARAAGHLMRNGNEITSAYIGATIFNRKMRQAETIEQAVHGISRKRKAKGLSPAAKNKMIEQIIRSALTSSVRESKIEGVLSGRISKLVESAVELKDDELAVIGQSLTHADVELPKLKLEHLPILIDAMPEITKLLARRRR